MGFSRQEYWSGLPFTPLGDLLDPGIEPTFLVFPILAGRSFTAGKTTIYISSVIYIYIVYIVVAQLVKNPSAMQETLVHFLGWEDLLENR